MVTLENICLIWQMTETNDRLQHSLLSPLVPYKVKQ